MRSGLELPDGPHRQLLVAITSRRAYASGPICTLVNEPPPGFLHQRLPRRCPRTCGDGEITLTRPVLPSARDETTLVVKTG